VPEENVLLIGIRDTYETQRRWLRSPGAGRGCEPYKVEGNMRSSGTHPRQARRVRRVYVHLDSGVLNPERVAPVNEFAPTGGLEVQ